MFKLDLEKAKELEIKLPVSVGSQKKQQTSRKTFTLALLTPPKPLTVWITTNCGKILKEMGIPDHLTCLLRSLYAGQEATVRTGHGTTDWFQIEKGVHWGCILSPCLFNFYAVYIMWNAGWMKYELEWRFLGEISVTSNIQMTPPFGRKQRGTKEPLDESERGEWKSWLKTPFRRLRSWYPVPSLHGKQMGKQWKQWETIFMGCKIIANGDCSHEIKRCLLLERKAVSKLDSILKSRDITLSTSSV